MADATPHKHIQFRYNDGNILNSKVFELPAEREEKHICTISTKDEKISFKDVKGKEFEKIIKTKGKIKDMLTFTENKNRAALGEHPTLCTTLVWMTEGDNTYIWQKSKSGSKLSYDKSPYSPIVELTPGDKKADLKFLSKDEYSTKMIELCIVTAAIVIAFDESKK